MRHLVAVAASLAMAAAPPAPAVAEDPVGSVAVGDFDGDGTPDVAAGLPLQRAGKLKEAGEVRAFSGKTGAFLWSRTGAEEEENFGEAIAAIGDADGDGATDLVVGAPYGESSPSLSILSGKTGKTIRTHTRGSLIGYGEEICAVGDGSGKERVDVEVRSGVSGKWTYAYTDREAVGVTLSDPAGTLSTTACVGDVDGDRVSDIAIGAWSEDADGKKSAGRLRVLSGAKLGGGGKPDLLVIKGEKAGDRLGLVAGPAGDWDGDGKGDIVAGIPGDDRAKRPWSVRVLSGASGAVLWKAEGAAGDFSIGGAVALGDLDEDGKPEFAVSNPGTKSKSGAVSAISSKEGAVLWTLAGASGERMGEELFAAPDADGDGVRDVVVLAPGSAVKGKKGNGILRLVSGKTGAVLCVVNPLAVK